MAASKPPPPRIAKLRATLASYTRAGRPTDDLKRELRAEVLSERIREAVSTWPELTSDQRARLAAILAPVATGGTA